MGLPCGVIIAVITCCDTLKKTIIARFMGLFSAFISQLIFEVLGIPYRILMVIFKNDSFVSEMGRLTVNETIGYGWGRMLFGGGLIISFIGTIVSIFIFDKVKRRRS